MVKRHQPTPGYSEFDRNDGKINWGKYSGLPDIRTGGSNCYDAWFLGPKAENLSLFKELVQDAIDAAGTYRRYFHPEDRPAITERSKNSPEYIDSVETLKYQFNILLQKLNEFTTPYASLRYQGHMLWDNTLPGMLGYFATMLHNPNNVTVQAATLTTFLGMVVGEDLCAMMGFDNRKVEPWGHITADGSLANSEAVWATREMKYLPLAIRHALINDPDYSKASKVEVILLDGSTQSIVSADTWQLLNLKMDDILKIPVNVASDVGRKEADVWQDLLHKYSLNTHGWLKFSSMCMDGFGNAPVIITPSTKHYSWPKAGAVMGLGCGPDSTENIWVDSLARMNLDLLRESLDKCVENQTPVLLTVSVMGSTEESAVDPLDGILEIREEYRQKGLEFNVHADAAWGGYLISTLRKDFDEPDFSFQQMDEKMPAMDPNPFIEDDSKVHLNTHTKEQFKRIRDCDSVTVDPHKCGYIQYPAGAILYRNTRLKNLVTFGAPVIGSPGTQPSVGEFGLEGSKPGASAAAVWLSHAVIRPSESGYGKLINASLVNAKLFSIRLWTMADSDSPFAVTPLAPLPKATQGSSAMDQLLRVADLINQRGVDEFIATATKEDLAFFNEIGPDQQIVDYTFNFKHSDDSLNKSLKEMNKLNFAVYQELHVDAGKDVNQYDLLITQTQMSIGDYGHEFIDSYLERMGIKTPKAEDYTIKVNRSVVMDPWVDSTPSDNGSGNFFDVIFGVLQKTVTQAIETNELR